MIWALPASHMADSEPGVAQPISGALYQHYTLGAPSSGMAVPQIGAWIEPPILGPDCSSQEGLI